MLRFQIVFLTALFNIFTLCFAENNQIVSTLSARLSANSTICVKDMHCKKANALKEFYKNNNFTLKWFKDGKLTSSAQNLIATLNTAYTDGLNPKKYHTKQINSLIKVLDSDEKNPNKVMVSLELSLSDAFLIYSNDLYYGMLNVKKVYPDWSIVKQPIDNIKELESAISDSELTIKDLIPIYPGYAKLKDKLHYYQEIDASGGFIKVPESGTIELGCKGDNVKALRNRLFMSGELNTQGGNKFDDELQKAVMQFQLNNGLFDDGIVESDTLVELNVSAKSRIRQIELNMDKMRLLPMDLKADYVLVNLLGYYLKVVHEGKDVLTMDIAVGGSEHPSCVLNSKIDYLVLNPYWNIPVQIAESEVWASVLKDPNYLNDKHIQILKKQNGEYKVIDSKGFNWSKMTKKEFNSYRYRQLPWKQNALGKVKFYFPNNCGIYLHDSNEPDLFEIDQRAFSHGCIRISQPLNLSTYLLNSQKKWSAHKVNNMFQNDINKTIKLVKTFNVYITYLTSFVSDDDFVQFRHDIYGFDKKANMANYSGFMPKKKR